MHKLVSAAILVAALAAPVTASAQTCIGSPARPGQFSLAAELGLVEDAKSYGVVGVANLRSPLSIGASVAQIRPDEGDENVMEYGALAAWQLAPAGQFSLCPVVGATYSSIDIDVLETTHLFVPVGVGMGMDVELDAFELGLFAIPQFVWSRISLSGEFLGEEIDESESESSWGLLAGAHAARGALFAGASVGLTGFEESETVVRLSVGFLLGRH